jgi:uncharacterized protein YpmB
MFEYQYDTSPRKVKTTTKRRKKIQKKPYLVRNKKTNNKVNEKPNLKLALGIVFVMLFIIIYRNSMVNEEFSKLQDLKKQATSIQKENEQLEVNIQNSINLNNIETSAKVLLGMEKLTSAQTVYIDLKKQDYVEASAEAVILEEDGNWIKDLKNKIINLF